MATQAFIYIAAPIYPFSTAIVTNGW